MKTLDKIIELLTKLIPIAGLFGALMYFVGRIYISRYYDTMGVPSGVLGFNTTDYVFDGAHPWRILIVLIFTLLGFLLFRFGMPEPFPWAEDIKDQPKLLWTEMKALYTEIRKHSKRLDAVVGFFMMLAYNFLWVFFLVIIAAGLLGSRNIGQDVSVIILSVLAAGSIILVLSDEPTVSIIKHSKILSWPFFLLAVVVFFIYPYVTASSYGSAMGAVDAQQHRLADTFQ